MRPCDSVFGMGTNAIKHFDFLKHFEYIDGIDFYRELFPVDSFQDEGIYSVRRPNGIAIEIAPDKTIYRRTITDDLECIRDMIGRFRRENCQNFCFTSPISYVGKQRKSSNARYLYALVIEVDNIIEKDGVSVGLVNLFSEIDRGFLPRPTFIVGSGSGVHLYFQFIKPVPLYHNIVEQLQRMKTHLTRYFWDKPITNSWRETDIQFESIFQAFRIPNTATKTGSECLAFRCGEPVSIEYLNSFVRDKKCLVDIVYQSKMTLEQAKKQYPEWYERRIVEGQKTTKWWNLKPAVYEWWKKRMKEGTIGHRYWCLYVLCVYATKCDIPRDQLEKDCKEFVEYFDSFSPPENPFTESDMLSALQVFEDESFNTFPINSIEYRTALRIEKNKRNGRTRVDNMNKNCRDILMSRHPNKDWNRRPDKKAVVKDWQMRNPSGTKRQCALKTGLSYNTVSKWWVSKGDNE